MWKSNQVYLEDLKSIITDSNIPWHDLDGKTVLVTGATGLIGSNIVNALLFYGEKTDRPPRILAFVRSRDKAKRVFSEQLVDHRENLSFIVGDICDPLLISEPIDYIIHAACETASERFITHPVETMYTAVWGTWNMLELARNKQVMGFLYLSSMEAYGSPHENTLLREDAPAYFDSSSVRNSYPESKRMCELLSSAFASEYNVPAKTVRLAQTFGPGVDKNDVRLFSYLARRAMARESIVLATKGESKRMYLYTSDAVRAILTILLKGKNGNCYNAANPDTYCSVYEMALLVSKLFSGGEAEVLFSGDPLDAAKYPQEHDLKLDISKILALGWRAYTPLSRMYARMIAGME